MRANNEQADTGGTYWGFPMELQEMNELVLASVLTHEQSADPLVIDVTMEGIVLSGLNAMADRAAVFARSSGHALWSNITEYSFLELPTYQDGRIMKVTKVLLDKCHLGALDALCAIGGNAPRGEVLRFAALEGTKIALSRPDIEERHQRLGAVARQNTEALRARILGEEHTKGSL